MLIHRVLTGVILIPVVLYILFYSTAIQFFIFTALLVTYGAWEWGYISKVSKTVRVFYIIAFLLVGLGMLRVPIPVILSIAMLWWIIATCLVLTYPKSSAFWRNNSFISYLMGFFVLLPCMTALNVIRNKPDGIYTLLFLFILIWGADTGAYFVGRKLGKNKLAPLVSPGKSWEGFYGAIITTVIIVIITLLFTKPSLSLWPFILVLSIITVVFSIVGDLFESMLKRNAGVKDSGKILPGHGGILDRIDSLTAAAPIFAFGALLLGQVV